MTTTIIGLGSNSSVIVQDIASQSVSEIKTEIFEIQELEKTRLALMQQASSNKQLSKQLDKSQQQVELDKTLMEKLEQSLEQEKLGRDQLEKQIQLVQEENNTLNDNLIISNCKNASLQKLNEDQQALLGHSAERIANLELQIKSQKLAIVALKADEQMCQLLARRRDIMGWIITIRSVQVLNFAVVAPISYPLVALMGLGFIVHDLFLSSTSTSSPLLPVYTEIVKKSIKQTMTDQAAELAVEVDQIDKEIATLQCRLDTPTMQKLLKLAEKV
jgi:hypothetical protein